MKSMGQMKIGFMLPIAAAVLTACGASEQDQQSAAADAVYLNAKIYTVDAAGTWASAMAITDGKIVAIGSDADIATHTSDATTVYDLHGRIVMPGIHDTHNHPSEAGIVNCYGGAAISLPLGGMKQSGNGYDRSLHALDKFTNLKTAWFSL